MRCSASEKAEIIRIVEGSGLSIRQTLRELDIAPSTFYGWYERWVDGGITALEDERPSPRGFWNRIPDHERDRVVRMALERPALSPRELAWHITDEMGYFISESSVYRILKAFDLITSPAYILIKADKAFRHPTSRIHQLWQTDFTYFKVIGWGWYYLATVLDDFSRYVIAWRLYTTMSAGDVKDVLDLAREKTGIDQVSVHLKPRLLSDNGPCYVAKDLGEYLRKCGIVHTRGAPYHPMTQGKIERYHRSMKNVICLENYMLPGAPEAAIGGYVGYYNDERLHEALDNVTPADVYFGRAPEILARREEIKSKTMASRRRHNMGRINRPSQSKVPTNRH